jgi:hypothetical protein
LYLVCQLGTTRRGKPDASLFDGLVGKIVGFGVPTDASVSTFEKPYDEVLGLDKPNSKGNNHEEEETRRTPPEPSQLTNYVTKPPASVTSDAGSDGAKPTNKLTRPTKAGRVAAALEQLYADDPDLRYQDADKQFQALFHIGLLADETWTTTTVKKAMTMLQEQVA